VNYKSSVVHVSVRYVVALTLFAIPGAVPAEAQIQNTVIATSGSAAPAGGNYQSFNTVSMNQRGQIVFDASLLGTSNSGVFEADRATISTVALGSNAGAPTDNFGTVGRPLITSGGEIFFSADTGFFRSNDKKVVSVVQKGDFFRGIGTLTPEFLSVDSENAIAFFAAIDGGVSTSGIFSRDGRRIEVIADDNTPAATGGVYSSFNGFVINEHRQVAFEAEMTFGSADFGVFRHDENQTKTIFASNRNAPGGGLFSDFSDPVMNECGEIAVVGAPLQNTTSSFGVFLSDGNKAEAVALDGQAAPAGGNYHLGTFAPLVLNDHGQLLFNIGLAGGDSSSGIFRAEKGHTEPIALQGRAAPGTTGTFAAFQNMKMLNDGRFAFVAQLTLGVGGVSVANNMGIWAGTSMADLELVARTGDTVGGNLVCVSASLDQFDLNERGIAWISRCPHRLGTGVIFSSFGSRDYGHF
jgi:hypothetical protein